MGLLQRGLAVALSVAAAGFLLSLVSDGRARLYWPPATWGVQDLPELRGRVALVTGANTGLGFATARELARRGATTFVATRSGGKSAETASKLAAELGASGSNVRALQEGLDLASLASVRSYAAALKKQIKKLDMLVLNAGVMMNPYALTLDGFEQQWGTNHLGHFLLTVLLMPELEKGSESRVVVVSSAGHNFAPSDVGIPFETLHSKEHYDPKSAYGVSKLSNILFAEELQRRVGGKAIFINSCHPGGVATDLQRHVYDALLAFGLPVRAVDALQDFAKSFFMTPEQGSVTQLFLAAASEVPTRGIRGRYFVPQARDADEHPFPIAVGKSRFVGDKALARKLWDYSVKLTGVDYGTPQP